METDVIDVESEEIIEDGFRSLLIAGNADDEKDTLHTEEVVQPDVIPPNKPIEQMSPSEQRQLSEHIMNEIDDHEDGLPQIPLNIEKLTFWCLESIFLAPAAPGEDLRPGVAITFAGPDDPRGTPYLLDRDRALKFASQLKRRALTGPSVQQRAAQSGLAIPQDAPSSGGLIIPGR